MQSAKVRIDYSHFAAVMYACAKSGRPSEATYWLSQAKRNSHLPNSSSFSSLVDVFRRGAADGGVGKSKVVPTLADVAARDSVAVSWLLMQMPQYGITPDVGTFVKCIAANLSAGRDEVANSLWDCIRNCSFFKSGGQNQGGDWSMTHYEPILLVLSRRDFRSCCSDLGPISDSIAAELWFGRMVSNNLRPTLHAYHYLLTGCVRAGRSDRVEFHFEQMHRCHNLTPDNFAHACRINAATYVGDVIGAQKYLDSSPQPCLQAVTSLVSAYTRLGNAQAASRLLDRVEADSSVVPDLTYLNAVVHAYGQAGDVEAALEVYYTKMQTAGGAVGPDVVTFKSLFSALRDASVDWQTLSHI